MWDYERKIVGSKAADHSFFLADDTGEVEVVPQHAELFVHGGLKFTSTLFRPFHPKVRGALEGLDMGSLLGGYGGLICRESLLLPGNQACVLGTAKPYQGTFEQSGQGGAIYIGSGKNNPFLIADVGNKELETDLTWKTAALLYGGPALTLVCIILFLKFHADVMP